MGLVVRGNYVWCLVIFVIFMGFGIWRSKEMGMLSEGTSGGGDNFNGEEDPAM